MGRQYCIYILTNRRNTVLYTGVTNDLTRRVYEHREKPVAGFTKKYNVSKLVYYEVADDIEQAILREKQIKAGSRAKKIALIRSMNPEWADLYLTCDGRGTGALMSLGQACVIKPEEIDTSAALATGCVTLVRLLRFREGQTDTICAH